MEKVSFETMGLFVAIVLLGINPLLNLVTFVMNQVRPQRREFSQAADYATKGELHEVKVSLAAVGVDLDALKNQIVINGDARRQAIEAKVESARKEAREDTETVRREVASVGRQIAATDATLKVVNQNLAQLSQEVRNNK